MDPAVQMVEDLATKIPGFDGAINMSWDQDHGVSPHLALSIITDETVESFVRDDGEPPDWRAVLRFLEEQSARNIPAIDTVIVTSFLDGLPAPGRPGYAIIDHLGPLMSYKFHGIRPGG
jgi:hypothetical protein